MNIFKASDGKCDWAWFLWNFTCLNTVTPMTRVLFWVASLCKNGPKAELPGTRLAYSVPVWTVCVATSAAAVIMPEQRPFYLVCQPCWQPLQLLCSRASQLTVAQELQRSNRSATQGGSIHFHLLLYFSGHMVSGTLVKCLSLNVKDWVPLRRS